MRLLKRLPALEGREVNFIAYALTTARNACYDAIEARRRMQPVAEQIEPGADEPREVTFDPERAALLAASREDVRAANARLSERQREVLALRELEQLSYEQIGEVVGLNDNAVAQLISRARIRLRAEIRGDALGSIATSSPDCERALPLLARLQDAQANTTDELDWLARHMAGCETCRLSCAAMEEAGASYRALGPVAVLAWLRHTTIAHAARFVGADWSHVAGPASVHGTTRSSISAPGIGRRMLAAAAVSVCLLVILAVIVAGRVTPDSRMLPQRMTVDPGVLTKAPKPIRPPTHVVRPVARNGVVGRHTSAGALAAVTSNTPSRRASAPTTITHHDQRVTRHKAVHHAHAVPAPATGTPSAPQPASTTPSSTTPAPSPPSAGSGESTGSGSGTPTSGGETSSPAETPASPPGGQPTETVPGCALAVAC